MASKPEIEGHRIIKQLLGQESDYGGAFCYITGAMGGGKTSAMASWMVYTLKHHPDQKIFFSETYDAPLQSFKVGKEYCQFFVKRGSGVVFRDINKKLKEVDLGQKYFDTHDELWEIAEPGKINTVFFGDRTEWMEFIASLRHKGEWVHVYIDEIGEVIPSNTSGKQHKRIGQFAVFSKDFRKCRMKVIANTQSIRDMDWRMLDKFMYRVFLPGAMADKKHSRVLQRAIDNLDGDIKHGNDAYIDRMGKFGLINFSDVFKPDPKYYIEAHNNNAPAYMAFDDDEEEVEEKPKKKSKKQKEEKIFEDVVSAT